MWFSGSSLLRMPGKETTQANIPFVAQQELFLHYKGEVLNLESILQARFDLL